MELTALVYTYSNFPVVGKYSFLQVRASIKYLRGTEIMTVLHGSTPERRLLAAETLPTFTPAEEVPTLNLPVLGVTVNL